MSTCNDLATKAELQELRDIVANKLDKGAEDRIKTSAANLAVPLAVTGAVTQLSPAVQGALDAAKRNASKIARNARNVATNVAGIASNALNIFGLIADIAALAIAFKHEFVDLPQIRRQLKFQLTQIEANFALAIANKKIAFQNTKTLERQRTDINRNQEAILVNSGLILDNQIQVEQNKKQIRTNQTQIIDNAIEITRIEKAYKRDLKEVEQTLRSEYTRDIKAVETRLTKQVRNVELAFDKRITQIQTSFQISQAIQDRQLQEAEAVISGLKNNIAGVRSDVKTIANTKANNSELTVIRRRVANAETTAEKALKTAIITRNTSGSSSSDSGILATLLEQINGLKAKDVELENLINSGGGAVNQQQLGQLRTDIKSDVKGVLGAAGLLSVPLLLSQTNAKVPTQSQLVQATQTGICNSADGGGCLNTKLRNPLAGKLDDLLTAFNTTANAGNVAINLDILARVTNIQGAVNSTTTGLAAISNFMKNAWSNTKLDKVLNVLNTVLALHNALMLSRNLGQTLGDVATSALQFLNIKDAENKVIDVNEFIGNTVNTWITNLVGAQTYANIQTTWISLNRIMVAAQGMVSAVQGVKNAVLESMETVGSWTAKIGNNMVIQGLLEERSFPWMNENINFRNPFGKFMQKIEVTEEILGQVNSLVSSGIEAQENFNELINNSSEVTTSSQKLAENLAQFDLDKEATEATETTNSASPDINNSDLIKSETQE